MENSDECFVLDPGGVVRRDAMLALFHMYLIRFPRQHFFLVRFAALMLRGTQQYVCLGLSG